MLYQICLNYKDYNNQMSNMLTIGESYGFHLIKDNNYPIIKVEKQQVTPLK